MTNFYDKFSFEQITNSNPQKKYDIKSYHQILEPNFPDFLEKYLNLPLLKRLSGIGLLCGSDWTKLFHNRFYYSRLDHSIGVALIIWHFTQDKAQTIAGLLHDVSTPVFSHVSDFRNGDALTQTSTEKTNISIIKNSQELLSLLKQDSLTVEEIQDYHIYPIADNEIPCLSADRLEYMYPSGMVLEGSWTLEEISKTYNDISILQNENQTQELGFNSLEMAELYCEKFCMTGHILQMNEDKLTLQLMGTIMNLAEKEKILCEQDFMTLSEKQILEKLENGKSSLYLKKLLNTFKNMEKIEHTQNELPNDEYFCVNLKVKQRYINPLVKTQNGNFRLNQISKSANSLINDFLNYSDTKFGCVKLI